MPDFKAKMHQIRFRWGSVPDSAEGTYSAPPDPPAVFKGSYFWGEKGEGRGGKEREGKVKGREGERRWMEGFGPHKRNGLAPPTDCW